MSNALNTPARGRAPWFALGVMLLMFAGQGCLNLGLHKGPNFYERVASEPSPTAHALYMQGRELMLAGKYADAQVAFRKAATLQPDNPLPAVWLVRADLEDGKAWRALRSAREAQARFPTDFELRVLEAVSLMATGDLAGAHPLLERLKPETPRQEALLRRAQGDLAYRRGMLDEAVAHWRASLEREPGQAELDRRIADIESWNQAAQGATQRRNQAVQP